MELEKLKEIIYDSIEELKVNHSFLLSRANNIAELAVSTKLASIMSNHFNGTYDIDVEWNRMRDKHGNYVPKRLDVPDDNLVQPDIIVHKRGNNEENLLVIEIKMTWKNKLKYFDLQKIQAYIDELKYKNGLYLELGDEGILDEKWY